MLFRKSTNMCCTKQTIYLIDKCYNYSIKTQSRCSYSCADSQVGHGQWPTQKSYKIRFLFQKECGQPYDFCREAGKVSQTYCVHIIHPRSTIFGTHILTMSIINNIKKFFE